MYVESLYAGRALQAGALGFVNKQEATETLIAAIHHVLSGKVYLSAEASRQFLANAAGAEPQTPWSPVRRLSNRELEVFELIGRGLTTPEIAARLHLSVKTIETHRENIKDKLDLKNAVELNRHAVQWVLENG